jgi:hypothetical protein
VSFFSKRELLSNEREFFPNLNVLDFDRFDDISNKQIASRKKKEAQKF